MNLQMYVISRSRTALVLLITLCHVLTADAQVLRRDTVPPGKRQVEIIHFNEDKKSSHKPENPTRSIVKTAPFSFIIGYLPVYYEYSVTDWLGLQAGAGVTFRPAVSNLISGLYAELYDYSEDESGTYRDYRYRTSKPGLMFSLSPRLYFQSDGLEGTYIAPEIRFITRRSKIQQPDPLYYPDRVEDFFDQESFRMTDIMVNYGWQELYPKLSVDFSIGAGIRWVSGEWQQVLQDFNGNYYSATPTRAETNFKLSLGFRLGFQL